MAAGDALVDEAAVFIQGLGSLGDLELVFHVGRHVDNLVRYTAGALFHSAEGGNQEAVFIGTGERGQVGDQADVGAFRRLNGAETAVMAVVNVSHIEGGSLSGETARAQCGNTPLVGQLGKGVGLVHELGKRR